MNMWERHIYFWEYLPVIINKNIYLDIPVMRRSSKFEKKWFYNKHQHRTADVGSFREDLKATLNKHPYDLYRGYEEIPAQ